MNGETSSLTRILFVDDSKVMLKTASKILRAEFDVITAVDGDDAWSKLELDPDIQVLFTDINMPGTDGYGLLKKVRMADDPGLRGMPVIMVTGADDAESARVKAMERGATDFIDKRALSAELLPRARAHAKYQRMTRQLQAQSTLDPLTGLANEAGFLARLEQDISYARRHAQELAIMRVEIEGLSTTFQDIGEGIVEQVVMHVANLIRARIRHEDTAGRIGLGGFAISAPGGHRQGIEAEAAKLQRQAAEIVFDIDGQAFPLVLHTAVIGAEAGAWSTPQDAMLRCQMMLDDERERTAAAAARAHVEQIQTARPAPEPTPQIAQIEAKEPVTAEATPATEPQWIDRRRDQPQPGATRPIIRKTLNALQRSLSYLWSMGAKQARRLARFLRKLLG